MTYINYLVSLGNTNILVYLLSKIMSSISNLFLLDWIKSYRIARKIVISSLVEKILLVIIRHFLKQKKSYFSVLFWKVDCGIFDKNSWWEWYVSESYHQKLCFQRTLELHSEIHLAIDWLIKTFIEYKSKFDLYTH